MALQFLSFRWAASELLRPAGHASWRIPMTLIFGGMMGDAAAAGLFGVYEGFTASRAKEPIVHTRYFFLFIGIVIVVHVTFMVFYK